MSALRYRDDPEKMAGKLCSPGVGGRTSVHLFVYPSDGSDSGGSGGDDGPDSDDGVSVNDLISDDETDPPKGENDFLEVAGPSIEMPSGTAGDMAAAQMKVEVAIYEEVDITEAAAQEESNEKAERLLLKEPDKSALLENELHWKNTEIAALNALLADASSKIDEMQAEIEDLRNDQAAYESDRRKFEANAATLQVKLDDKHDEFVKAMDDLEQLNSENEEYARKIESYEEQAEDYKNSQIDYKVRYPLASSTSLRLNIIGSSQTPIAIFKKIEMEMLRSENSDQVRKMEILNSENADLQKQTQTLEEGAARLNGDLTVSREERDKLQDSLRETAELLSDITWKRRSPRSRPGKKKPRRSSRTGSRNWRESYPRPGTAPQRLSLTWRKSGQCTTTPLAVCTARLTDRDCQAHGRDRAFECYGLGARERVADRDRRREQKQRGSPQGYFRFRRKNGPVRGNGEGTPPSRDEPGDRDGEAAGLGSVDNLADAEGEGVPCERDGAAGKRASVGAGQHAVVREQNREAARAGHAGSHASPRIIFVGVHQLVGRLR